MKHAAYRVLATLTFFTRLPLWRIANVPKEYYERVVPLWPLAGWMTGSVMACCFILTNEILPTPLCIVLAIASRLLLTGALHEDGFADFCDGFGGGTSRQRTLEIMKDSHIGSYGVIGLIIYYLLLFCSLSSLPVQSIPYAILIGDVSCKWISANIINVLPYARKESEAKNKLIYSRMRKSDIALSIVLCLVPYLLAPASGISSKALACSMLAAAATATVLFFMMHKKIQGYTGDCCGATFISAELVYYITLCAF